MNEGYMRALDERGAIVQRELSAARGADRKERCQIRREVFDRHAC
jgi:hypothetical protein